VEGATRYAKSGELNIAYQVLGDGPFDLLFAPGYMSHLEQNQWLPSYSEFLQRMASFSRLIVFDRRGTGLSDRILALGSYEEMLDDVRAVLDDVGSEQAALFGGAEGGPICALFAATFPERTSALILGASYARRAWAPDYPWGLSEESHRRILESYATQWESGSFGLRRLAPTRADDERFRQWYAQACRFAGTPSSALAWFRVTMEIDIREVLAAIRVPTLVINSSGDQVIPPEAGRYLAEHIPHAKHVELPGSDHFPFTGEVDYVAEIEEFLTGSRSRSEPDRVLATVLFTDIVSSTEHAAELGDRSWTALLSDHHTIVRECLARFRGREIRITGDGVLATFDGPARAVRCACAVRDAVRRLGIEIRAGLHTGEIELADTGAEGIAVHLGARIAALAQANEVLVSSTVKDLVVGSGIAFAGRGTHDLKGVPGKWEVFLVADAASGH
jgi:pimeloyl-ACP methyl ester carboxylesterase/class 3 adenylate cyclase